MEFTPAELAELLGLPPEDGPYLSKAPVRLPTAWVACWRSKLGPLELTPADVAMLLGVQPESVYRYLKAGASRQLKHRAVGCGKTWMPRVAPADLVEYLRAANRARNNTPVIVETPAQFRKRAERDRLEAMRACGCDEEELADLAQPRRGKK
jgi:hypothetical protein